MNVLMRELKANRKSLLIWSVGVILLIASSMGKYAGMSASGQSINDLLAKMPKSLQAIWGVGTFDVSTATGYYALLFVYLSVMATIHAAMLGANIIAKEERDKTAEFLFVKPISRNQIVTSKLLAAFTNVFIFNLVTLVSSILLVNKYSNGSSVNGDIMVLMAGMFLLQLIFLSLGAGIAAMTNNPKKAASLATGVLLTTFIFSIIVDLNNKLSVLKYLTPFKYFDAKGLLLGAGFEGLYLALTLIIVTVLTSLTYRSYHNRDLKI